MSDEAESMTLLFPVAVRQQILEQHDDLRDLLRRTLGTTTRGLLHEGLRDDLAAAVDELAGRFKGHLAYEERHLVPVLAHVDGWGPERVETLLDEHRRQRAELATLVEGAQGDWDVERMALTLRSFAADLLMDMEEEERGCLRPDLLGDDVIMVEVLAARKRPATAARPARVFDKMTEHAAIWVKDMMEALGTDDPRKGLHALRAGLHALRDRLRTDEAAQLAAQLPLVIRGLFFENWDPSRTPLRIRHPADFLALVRQNSGPRECVPADEIIAALFRVLAVHVSMGELTHIMMNLPASLATLANPRAVE